MSQPGLDPAASPNLQPFAWVALIYPLEMPWERSRLASWNLGAWPVKFDAEEVDRADRLRRYHVLEPITAITDESDRRWLGLAADVAAGVSVRGAELLDLTVAGYRQSYLVLHLDLIRGVRGGTSEAVTNLATLVRLQSKGLEEEVRRLLPGAALAIDQTFMRAVTIAGLPATTELLAPPRVKTAEPLRGWLTALTDFPRSQHSAYKAGDREIFDIVPGVRGSAAAGGVAVASESGGHLRERTFRAHYVDAMLIATVQRDVLLRLAAELARSATASGRATRTILESFDEFRASWWKPIAVDHPVSAIVGQRWRQAVGVDALMEQMIGEVADLHQARRTEQPNGWRLFRSWSRFWL